MTGLASYQSAAAGTQLLTAAAERRLAHLVRDGSAAQRRLDAEHGTSEDTRIAEVGAEARRILIESNLRLVMSIANRFPAHTLVDRADLIQAGNQGLMIAVDKFDPDRGFRFSTYATRWIRSKIIRTLDQSTAAVHLPIDTVNAIRTAIRSGSVDGGAAPRSLVEAARAYDAVSLDMPLPEGASIGELRPSGDEPIELTVERRLGWDDLRRALAALPDQHRDVLLLRYGFVDDQTQSLKRIADRLGISIRRTHRLLAEAAEMMRSSKPGLVRDSDLSAHAADLG